MASEPHRKKTRSIVATFFNLCHFGGKTKINAFGISKKHFTTFTKGCKLFASRENSTKKCRILTRKSWGRLLLTMVIKRKEAGHCRGRGKLFSIFTPKFVFILFLSVKMLRAKWQLLCCQEKSSVARSNFELWTRGFKTASYGVDRKCNLLLQALV